MKKHLHHLSRGVVLCSEIAGMAVLVLLTAWLLLITRLSQGPLQVDFLTKSIERSFNKEQAGFRFSIGSTRLTWGGTGQPLIFEMNHVQIMRDDKTPVLSVEKIGVQLSKKHLVFGEIVPRVIRIYGPALRVVHGEDGHFTLNISGEEAVAPDPVLPSIIGPVLPSLAAPVTGQADLVKTLLTQMHDASRATLLGGLDEISVNDAALLYEDKILNVSWKSNKTDLVFTRGHAGLDIDALVNIAQDPQHIAVVRSNFSYDWNTRKSKGTVSFTNFNPSLFAQQSDALKNLSGVDLPVKGSLYMTLDEDFNPGYGRIALGADPGKFSIPGLYDDPLPVDKFYMEGKFDGAAGEVVLDSLRADLGGPKVTASGSITQQAAGHALSITAALEGLPLDRLKNYWPAKLTPDPRAWVTGHLSAGIATKATLDLALIFPHACTAVCAKPWDDFGPGQVQKVGGQIDFNGVKVDYFPPLMPVLKVRGKATYDQKSFHLDLSGGALGDMKVTHSKIDITDLDIADEKTHSKIDISAALEGPLKTALKVLDSKPLQYPEKLGIQTADVGGDATVDVNFKFPLYKALALEDVKVTAKAKLNNVQLPAMVAGLPLSGGPMDLTLGSGALNIKGKGLLGKMPATFDWLKNFAGKAAVASKVEASLTLDTEALKAFGVPDDLKLAGTLPATVNYTVAGNTAALVLKGDVTPAGFTLPVAGYEKPPGVAGTLGLSLRFKNGLLSHVDDLTLTTDKLHIKGNAGFASDGKTLKSADFKQVKLDDTDVSLAVSSRGSDGYDVKVSGTQFNASKFLKEDSAPNSDANAAVKVAPITISMAVDRLITGTGRSLGKLRLFMRRNTWSRIDQLQVDGVAGGQTVALRYMPVANGHTLSFEANNAGAALSALGITNGVRGGRVVVNGAPNNKAAPGSRDLRGTVVMTDFSLVDVPVLGRLLNALSLSGIIELLNGKGIAFKKMRSDFWWFDRGEPESYKNTRILMLKDGQTSGASLGLTFEGQMDNWRNTLDMSGTIIPVSDINKMLSFVPLVGDILTGGGKGVFAATYTVKGPKSDPNISVNPLSVLAPGILRKVFFEH